MPKILRGYVCKIIIELVELLQRLRFQYQDKIRVIHIVAIDVLHRMVVAILKCNNQTLIPFVLLFCSSTLYLFGTPVLGSLLSLVGLAA